MKKIFFSILCLNLFAVSFAQQNTLPIIPQPTEVSLKSGYFKLSPETKIILNDENLKSDVDWFNE